VNLAVEDDHAYFRTYDKADGPRIARGVVP